ncbi:hypothetical protein GCM10007161_20420 [Ignatzschineria indica]|uniref:Uncharacterized protein n=1 Tax=Ignatzschineria indica TaxID=472583 RepID=A0A2U2AHW4_9GAMM|nr:hypothetical protein [Ignatzschineria indica]PWD82220.1 hypothetical protein DC082_10425 [Ignatzschineria indica]GGZ88762.1 hypothetical protein GCM10007161_20420 [Ignatzschineria indica]
MEEIFIKHYEDKTLGEFLSSKEYSDNKSYRGILIELHKNSTIDLVNNISDVLNKSNDHNTFAVMQYLEVIKEISLNYDEVVSIINYLKTICEQRYEYYSLYELLNNALETKTITELDKLYNDAINNSELYEYTYFIFQAYLKIDASKAYELAVNLFSLCNTELFIACSNILFVFDYENLGFDKLNAITQLLLQRQSSLSDMDKELSQILYVASHIYDSYPQDAEEFFLDIFDYILKFNDEGHLELLDKLRFFCSNISSSVWKKYSKLILDYPTKKNLNILLLNNYSFLASESCRLTYIKLIEELLISNKIQGDQLQDFYQMIQYCKLQDALMTRWLLSKNPMLIYIADDIFYGVALDATSNFDASLLEEQEQDQSMFFNLIDHCCGTFYLYPNIVISFLLSLLDLNIDQKSILKIQLHIQKLFIPSYPYAIEGILKKIKKNTSESLDSTISNIQKESQEYLIFIESLQYHRELFEDISNKQLRFSEQNRQRIKVNKQINKQSVFNNLFSKSLILYGRGSRQTYNVTASADSIFNTSSVKIDLPILKIVSPVETRQFLHVLRTIHWEARYEINN